jgi:hypothetical protein
MAQFWINYIIFSLFLTVQPMSIFLFFFWLASRWTPPVSPFFPSRRRQKSDRRLLKSDRRHLKSNLAVVSGPSPRPASEPSAAHDADRLARRGGRCPQPLTCIRTAGRRRCRRSSTSMPRKMMAAQTDAGVPSSLSDLRLVARRSRPRPRRRPHCGISRTPLRRGPPRLI